MDTSDNFSVLTTLAAVLLTIVPDVSGSMRLPIERDDDANDKNRLSPPEPKFEGLTRGIQGMLTYLTSQSFGVTPLVGFVTFGRSIQTYSHVPAENATCPTLLPDGKTPMAEGIHAGLDLYEAAAREIANEGVPMKTGTFALISDGAPSSSESEMRLAIERLAAAKRDYGLNTFGIALGEPDARRLRQLGFDPTEIILTPEDWARVFRLLSIASIRGGSKKGQKPFSELAC